MKNTDSVDIAIVGGGVSGLYCFLQLARAMKGKKPLKCLDNKPPRSIRLYEASDRFGGRIETWSFPLLGSPKYLKTRRNE